MKRSLWLKINNCKAPLSGFLIETLESEITSLSSVIAWKSVQGRFQLLTLRRNSIFSTKKTMVEWIKVYIPLLSIPLLWVEIKVTKALTPTFSVLLLPTNMLVYIGLAKTELLLQMFKTWKAVFQIFPFFRNLSCVSLTSRRKNFLWCPHNVCKLMLPVTLRWPCNPTQEIHLQK